jgi:hypothetical protein
VCWRSNHELGKAPEGGNYLDGLMEVNDNLVPGQERHDRDSAIDECGRFMVRSRQRTEMRKIGPYTPILTPADKTRSYPSPTTNVFKLAALATQSGKITIRSTPSRRLGDPFYEGQVV